MQTLSHHIQQEVLATAEQMASEASLALQRGLETTVLLRIVGGGPLDREEFGQRFSSPGLAMVVRVEEEAALIVIAASSGLLPAWCAEPSRTQQNRLNAMAQELGVLFLPDQIIPSRLWAGRVDDLVAVLQRAGVKDTASWFYGDLRSDTGTGSLGMIWPAPRPDAIFDGDSPPLAPPPPRETKKEEKTSQDVEPQSRVQGRRQAHTQHLLKIKVPVRVTLGVARQSLQSILQLNRGVLIHLGKPSDQVLTLEVGDRPIADGEAVKVGEQFGLRILSLRSPERSLGVPP